MFDDELVAKQQATHIIYENLTDAQKAEWDSFQDRLDNLPKTEQAKPHTPAEPITPPIEINQRSAPIPDEFIETVNHQPTPVELAQVQPQVQVQQTTPTPVVPATPTQNQNQPAEFDTNIVSNKPQFTPHPTTVRHDPSVYHALSAEDDKYINPEYYRIGMVEAIDVMERLGLSLGTVVKYLWRGGLKSSDGDHMRGLYYDMDKAKWYLTRLLGKYYQPMTKEQASYVSTLLSTEFMGADQKRGELIRAVVNPFIRGEHINPEGLKIKLFGVIDEFVKYFDTDPDLLTKAVNRLFSQVSKDERDQIKAELMTSLDKGLFTHNELCYLDRVAGENIKVNVAEVGQAYYVLKAMTNFGVDNNIYHDSLTTSIHTLRKVIEFSQDNTTNTIALIHSLSNLYKQDRLAGFHLETFDKGDLLAGAGVFMTGTAWHNPNMSVELSRIARKVGRENLDLAVYTMKDNGMRVYTEHDFMGAIKFLLSQYLAYQASIVI